MADPFDPTFDDCTWTDEWLNIPIVQVVPGVYDSFTVTPERITEAEVCGQQVVLNLPLDIRVLKTNDGTLWMSDVPQERVMMYNNAIASSGETLVGGLGLGLYPQYALPHITRLTIVEQNTDIVNVVSSVVQIAADAAQKPLHIQHGSIENILSKKPDTLYDTIFLDTWDVLDAVHLPHINHLRDLAKKHVKPDGKILLWGYVWMLKLFSTAVELMFSQSIGKRRLWLQQATNERPDVYDLLQPVLEYGNDNPNASQTDIRLWSLQYIINKTGSTAQ